MFVIGSQKWFYKCRRYFFVKRKPNVTKHYNPSKLDLKSSSCGRRQNIRTILIFFLMYPKAELPLNLSLSMKNKAEKYLHIKRHDSLG